MDRSFFTFWLLRSGRGGKERKEKNELNETPCVMRTARQISRNFGKLVAIIFSQNEKLRSSVSLKLEFLKISKRLWNGEIPPHYHD